MVHAVVNQTFLSNTYILCQERGNKCIVIDPGLNGQEIDAAILALDCSPTAILSTHGHFDHIGSVGYLQKKYKVPFYLHESDLKLSQSANFYLKLAKIDMVIDTPYPDRLFHGSKESLVIEGFKLSIQNFPGHTQGSCTIQYENALFTGDIIYKKGLGLNNFPGENRSDLRNSISSIFKSFSEDTLILPGHGKPEYMKIIQRDNLELMNFLQTSTD